MTSEVQSLPIARNSAFKSGNQVMYSSAKADLKKGIREAKLVYTNKQSEHLSDNNLRQAWKGLKHITNIKGNGAKLLCSGGEPEKRGGP